MIQSKEALNAAIHTGDAQAEEWMILQHMLIDSMMCPAWIAQWLSCLAHLSVMSAHSHLPPPWGEFIVPGTLSDCLLYVAAVSHSHQRSMMMHTADLNLRSTL